MLSDGNRLIVINPNELLRSSSSSVGRNGTSPPCIVADYHLGDQFGHLSYADFILNSQRVLVHFETRVHASILSLTKAQRDDIPGVKFSSDLSFACSPGGCNVALLLRVKGQDQVIVLGLDGEDLQVRTTFNTHTNDAQSLTWSPDGEPVLAVTETAVFPPRIIFFTALGHEMKQLELSPSHVGPDPTGIGISNFKWLSSRDSTFMAVADGEKRVLLRRQHNRTMVSLVQPSGIIADHCTGR